MSKVIVLSRAAVFRHLPMATCIPIVERALRDVAAGRAIQPIRTRISPPDIQGVLGMMPGYLGTSRTLGIKVVTVFEGNFARNRPSHGGAILVFDAEDGALKGIIDAGAVTAIRTAAASAVATRALALPQAERLAILGYGEQAHVHAEAMLLVRPIRYAAVWGRSSAKAAEFAATLAARHSIDARAEATVAAAVAGAQIICTTTAAKEPILHGKEVAAGCHVNLVGSSFPDAREVDTDLVARGLLFADDRPMVEALAGELRAAIAESAVTSDHLLGTIGEVLNGSVAGRRSASDVTIFKSVGLIAEDLAAASYLLETAAADTADDSITRIDL